MMVFLMPFVQSIYRAPAAGNSGATAIIGDTGAPPAPAPTPFVLPSAHEARG
jgi:hypothetical protein